MGQARASSGWGAVMGVVRPWQWVKNAFVLAPLLFSGEYRDLSSVGEALLAFAAFCGLASGLYALNDVADRKADREHPTKRNRPVASGAVSVGRALAVGLAMAAVGLVLSGLSGRVVLVMGVLYLVLGVMYSLGLKHVVIVDVMVLAGGFVLRILAGAAAIEVPASHWLVLCTIMVALFLGFTKRRAEMASEEGTGEHTRPVLAAYSVGYLDQVIAMVTGATIVSYALYTVDEHTVALVGSRAMLLTVPFVIYGLLRYVYLIYHLAWPGDPTRALLRDAWMLADVAAWAAVSAWVVGYGKGFALLT